MGGGYVANTAVFVIEMVSGIVILVFMIRFLLQLVQADFYNPISRMVVTLTQPVLRPLRRVIPGLAGLDLSSLLVMLVLQLIALLLLAMVLGYPVSLPGLIVLAFAELLQLAIYVFMGAIIILVILSWVQPHGGHPLMSVLTSLSGPVMRPARRLLPPFGGLDLSPLLALLVLGVVLRLLIAPVRDLGLGLAFGGEVDGRVRVRVNAPPVDNAANRRVTELIAEAFGVPRSRVEVVAGAARRDKRLKVTGARRLPPWYRAAED